MIAKDAIGNTLQEGHVVMWSRVGLLAKVTRIEYSGLVDMKAKTVTPGKLVVEIELPFEPKGAMVGFSEFIRVVDPREEARAEAVLAAVGGEHGQSV